MPRKKSNKMNDLYQQCAICNNKLNPYGKCPAAKCYEKHQYEYNDDDFADFYLDKYIIEYHFNKDKTFKTTVIIKRGNGGALHILDHPLNFSSDPLEEIRRIEKLQIFK